MTHRKFGDSDSDSSPQEAKYTHGLNGGEILLVDGNCGWRACYGPSQQAGQELARRNNQIQQEMQNVPVPGEWQPDPTKLRSWNARPDYWQCSSANPAMCVMLPDGRVVDRYNPNDPSIQYNNPNYPYSPYYRYGR